MTKSEVRAISIDKLNLYGSKTLLDIGAGTGSISIQAAREHPDLQVIAVERNQDGIDIINQNLDKYNLSNVAVIEGSAPESIPNQNYDAIFVGGTGPNMAEIIDFTATHLNDRGAVVLNFILFENAIQAEKLLQQTSFKDIEMVETTVMKWHGLGKGHYFKPNNPTIILSAIKEEN